MYNDGAIVSSCKIIFQNIYIQNYIYIFFNIKFYIKKCTFDRIFCIKISVKNIIIFKIIMKLNYEIIFGSS